MTSIPIQLRDEEELDTLRRLDHYRGWQSLDEMRYCLVCGKLVTGHQIQVVVDGSKTSPTQLVCPTEHCNSVPIDWVLPTNELLAALSMRNHDRIPQAADLTFGLP